MAVNLQVDALLNTAWGEIGEKATGLVGRIEAILNAVFLSTGNPFGAVAKLDVGQDAGNVPLVGAGNTLPKSIFPAFAPGSFSGTIPTARFPNLSVSKIKAASALVDGSIDRIKPGNVPNLPASVITSGVLDSRRLPALTNQIDYVTGSGTIRTLQWPGPGATPSNIPALPDGLASGVEKVYAGVGTISDVGVLSIAPVWIAMEFTYSRRGVGA